MASIIERRRQAQRQAFLNSKNKEQENTEPELTFGEKSKLAHELVKSGEASDLKEAWQILRDRGVHK